MEDSEYRHWKQHLVPFLYDWISNHKLTWPSQTCRWGQKLEDSSPNKAKYRLFISEQTDGSEPQKLTVCTADVYKPRVAGPEAVSNWSEFSKSSHIKEHKIIFHPGEVNKVRELPQHPNIVVTHTDLPDLFVWNVDKQPSRQRKEDKADKRSPKPSVADLKLVGHKDDATFPLATCSTAPTVASGGTDKLVLVWNLQDRMEALQNGGAAGVKEPPSLKARTTLSGHSNTVEDVVFQPGSGEQLASVGDDHRFLLWDTRAAANPVNQVAAAHGGEDIHCVDWSALDDKLIATGAADGSLKVWDVRKLGSSDDCMFKFTFHTAPTMRVEWHPHARGVLASGGDDKIVAVWDLNRGSPADAAGQGGAFPPQLMFQHLGHKNGKVVDFQWNPHDPWVMVSVSDDTDGMAGGGTLHMWRMNDMIYRPEEEVVQELESHRRFILHGEPVSKPPPPASAAKASSAAAAEEAAEAAAKPSAAEAGQGDTESTAPAAAEAAGAADAAVAAEEPPLAEEAVEESAEGAAEGAAEGGAEEAVKEAVEAAAEEAAAEAAEEAADKGAGEAPAATAEPAVEVAATENGAAGPDDPMDTAAPEAPVADAVAEEGAMDTATTDDPAADEGNDSGGAANGAAEQGGAGPGLAQPEQGEQGAAEPGAAEDEVMQEAAETQT